MKTIKFNFQKKTKNLDLVLPFSQHIEELRQRLFFTIFVLLLISIIAFIEVKPIVHFLELPVPNVKFFQLSPGEYFLATVKIAFYTGILFSSPIVVSQLLFFVIPGLTSVEKKYIIPILIGSVALFGLSVGFSYYTLIPAALGFFISYSADTLEPLWSFNQYFDFILVLFYTTGLAFQIPIFQVVLGLLGIVSGTQMFNIWKYIVLGATVIGAILTPSTDPVTQLLLSGAILFLYFLGATILLILKK